MVVFGTAEAPPQGPRDGEGTGAVQKGRGGAEDDARAKGRGGAEDDARSAAATTAPTTRIAQRAIGIVGRLHVLAQRAR
jgi:hypothetical protein